MLPALSFLCPDILYSQAPSMLQLLEDKEQRYCPRVGFPAAGSLEGVDQFTTSIVVGPSLYCAIAPVSPWTRPLLFSDVRVIGDLDDRQAGVTKTGSDIKIAEVPKLLDHRR